MLGTTFRAFNSGGLGEAQECAFLTSSQVTPVTSLLPAQAPNFENCCCRGILILLFPIFLLHKLPRWAQEVLDHLCDPWGPHLNSQADFFKMRIYSWVLDVTPAGKRVALGSTQPAWMGWGSAQQTLSTWAAKELSLPSLTLPFYPGHLK